GQAKWNEFRSRVREHNLRIVSKYYTSISMPRLAHIVGFAPTAVAEVESFLSDLVIKGMVYARIDRPNQTVSFVQPESAEDKLNSWANNVSELLNLVESTTHLLSKEETGRELA
ncbi:proteasome regulatory particle subunit, partial [Spiromyces aspiralis]